MRDRGEEGPDKDGEGIYLCHTSFTLHMDLRVSAEFSSLLVGKSDFSSVAENIPISL